MAIKPIKQNRNIMKTGLVTPATNKMILMLKKHGVSIGDLLEWAAPLKLAEANGNCPLISTLVMNHLFVSKETLILREGDTIDNPASTKHRIHGPVKVHIQRFNDGGINVTLEDLEETGL